MTDYKIAPLTWLRTKFAELNHTHTVSDVTDLDISGKEDKSNKTSSWNTTTNNTRYPTEKLVKDSLDGKANSSHNHDDRYYTETEIDEKIDEKIDLDCEFINGYWDTNNANSISGISVKDTNTLRYDGKTFIYKAPNFSSMSYTGDLFLKIITTDYANGISGRLYYNDQTVSIEIAKTLILNKYVLLKCIQNNTFTEYHILKIFNIFHNHNDSYYNKTEIDGKIITDISGLTDNQGLLFSGDYDDLTDKPNIPSSSSDLTDGSNIIKKSSTNGLIKNDGSIDTNTYLTSSSLNGYQTTNNLVTSFSQTTSDTKYPSEKLTKDSLDNKVDKVTGKGLSTNDFSGYYKGMIDNLSTVATTGDYNDLSNIPTDLLTESDVSSVALSGDYNDLDNTPTIPSSTSELYNDGDGGDNKYVLDDDISDVAESGDYDDLINKPSYTPTVTSSTTGAYKIGSINVSGSNVDIYGKDIDTVYTHPTYSNVAKSTSAIYKIKTNNLGHIIEISTVSASDLPSHNHDDRYYTEIEVDDIIDTLNDDLSSDILYTRLDLLGCDTFTIKGFTNPNNWTTPNNCTYSDGTLTFTGSNSFSASFPTQSFYGYDTGFEFSFDYVIENGLVLGEEIEFECFNRNGFYRITEEDINNNKVVIDISFIANENGGVITSEATGDQWNINNVSDFNPYTIKAITLLGTSTKITNIKYKANNIYSLNDNIKELQQNITEKEDKFNKVTSISSSSTDTQYPSAKLVYNQLNTKAPTSHASSSSTYGLATSSNYGHTKIINNLTQSSNQNGTALSAYQGKVLNDNKLARDSIDTYQIGRGVYEELSDYVNYVSGGSTFTKTYYDTNLNFTSNNSPIFGISLNDIMTNMANRDDVYFNLICNNTISVGTDTNNLTSTNETELVVNFGYEGHVTYISVWDSDMRNELYSWDYGSMINIPTLYVNASANSIVAFNILELQNVDSEQQTKQINAIANVIYPVGSIYMSMNSTSPQTLFGGVWEQIEDKFLLSAGSTYTAGSTGGSATVTLTSAQSGLKAHSHGMAHTHKHRHDLNKSFSTGSGSVNAYTVTSNRSTSTQYTGYDETASSKSTTDNNTASNASEAHNNMPPYLTVYMWKRIA